MGHPKLNPSLATPIPNPCVRNLGKTGEGIPAAAIAIPSSLLASNNPAMDISRAIRKPR